MSYCIIWSEAQVVSVCIMKGSICSTYDPMTTICDSLQGSVTSGFPFLPALMPFFLPMQWGDVGATVPPVQVGGMLQKTLIVCHSPD